ncbi:MAG: stage V sporulation protein AE [Firmicutes bacterium]|uniref:Stage V sporulation protein AE n=1 Tax=Melghirimyces thermohalophilus TaxID=1236220 RepID=A0A1G6LMG8_9BACL|nr:stage V sporulation protein AE [Melghirimyces thermohalophilus]MDA8353803.1 stage V sporulation protein AE [Bacillota bacterium]SDC44440.1 stage V sporulation protein AE [Melghirimyces thermohalophilus]
MAPRQVILITDGDRVAKETVEEVARQVGGRCISASAGNPTPLTGLELVEQIQMAAHDPVLVMFDDSGSAGKGRGEQALEYVMRHPEVEVLGVVAVASNCYPVQGTPVDIALDREGRIVESSVDKDGLEMIDAPLHIFGDTLDVLNAHQVPIIIGVGDVGKMDHYDDPLWGAPVTTKAVRMILDYHKDSPTE